MTTNNVTVEGTVEVSQLVKRGKWESIVIVISNTGGAYDQYWKYEMAKSFEDPLPPVGSEALVEGFAVCRKYQNKNTGEDDYFTKLVGMNVSVLAMPGSSETATGQALETMPQPDNRSTLEEAPRNTNPSIPGVDQEEIPF